MNDANDFDGRIEGPTDCERCGADRPANPERFTITATDHTDATISYEKVFLCPRCWRSKRDELRRGLA